MSKKRSPAGFTVVSRPPVQQRRSQRTFDRLLSAATRVLHREGLDGATVPRIAAEAKLSPASIYRRFADKDDLVRAALLRTLDALHTASGGEFQNIAKRETLAAACEALATLLLRQHREHARLMSALTRIVQDQPDSPFALEAIGIHRAILAQAAEALLAHRASIRHPDPERAAAFAVLSVISSLESAAAGQSSLWRAALPLSDKALTAELCRQMVGYLRRKA